MGKKLRGPDLGPDLVPIAADWSNWVGVMVATHFGLVSGLFWAPRDPKRAHFGRKCPFWGLRRDSEGPRGPHLVATAADRSDWVGIMVATPFGLVLGLLLAPRGPKWARFGPKSHFGGPGGTQRARRDQIWSQRPRAAAPRLDSWLPETSAWYRASSWQPRL